jgi:hypothetical protein
MPALERGLPRRAAWAEWPAPRQSDDEFFPLIPRGPGIVELIPRRWASGRPVDLKELADAAPDDGSPPRPPQ